MLKDRVTFSIYVDTATRRKLDKLAKVEDRSIAYLVRRAIDADLDRRGEKALAA